MRDSLVAEGWISALHLADGGDQFWRRAFRPRLAAAFRREEQLILSSDRISRAFVLCSRTSPPTAPDALRETVSVRNRDERAQVIDAQIGTFAPGPMSSLARLDAH